MSKAKTSILTLVLTAVSFLVVVGCDSGYDCSIENTAYNRIGFYNAENGTDEKYEFPDVLNVSMMINGHDSTVVNHITYASELQLPMSFTHDCDTIIFSYENSATDTIFVKHDNIPYFVSMECGTAMYHRITGITHTTAFIDSVVIVNDYINYDYNENVKLYLVK
ncbi:MAG: hypothetical protein J6U58_06525 [Bacteroidaceae bacterium]|nr:hypothetical protein [Bacteroidaceae bacterium]